MTALRLPRAARRREHAADAALGAVIESLVRLEALMNDDTVDAARDLLSYLIAKYQDDADRLAGDPPEHP